MVSEKEFLKFAARIIGVQPESLALHTAYGSIPKWDSIIHLRLVMEFEVAYGVSIPIEAVPELKTLGDFYGRIHQ